MGMVIVNPGIYTTVQDEGRFGYEQFGVSPAGPMDRRSFHIANLLVGNDIGEAELEMTIIGTEIRFTGPAVIALTGADMSPLLNEAPVCMYRAFPVGAGDVLRMQSVSGGCRGTGYSCGDGKQIHPCEEWYRRLPGQTPEKRRCNRTPSEHEYHREPARKMDAGRTQ